MVKARYIWPIFWLLLVLPFVLRADDYRKRSGFMEHTEMISSPTKELAASLFDKNCNWGFNAMLISKKQGEKWVAPTMIVDGFYCPLVDITLFPKNKKIMVPIRNQRYFITIDKKGLRLKSTQVNKRLTLKAWVGELKFSIHELVADSFVIEINKKQNGAICFDFKDHLKYTAEGIIELCLTQDDWYCGRIGLAGCPILDIDFKNATSRDCDTDLLIYPPGFFGSRFNEQMQIVWRQWH